MEFRKLLGQLSAAVAIVIAGGLSPSPVFAAQAGNSGADGKPNIILIDGDDVGWGDLGTYMGDEGSGKPAPNPDRMAAEGMTFYSFYGQPSFTPGLSAIMTGRIPNRSGMTTVAFQGPGGPQYV
jgi:arylsulfatase A-like enzyme